MRRFFMPATVATCVAAGLVVPATSASAADLAPKDETTCSVVTTAAEREFAKTYADEEKNLGGKLLVGKWVSAIERVYPEAATYTDVELLKKLMPEPLAQHYLDVRDSASSADIPFGPTGSEVADLAQVGATEGETRPTYADPKASARDRTHAQSLTSALVRHFPGLKPKDAEALAAVIQNDATGEYFNTRLAYENVLAQAAWDCRDLVASDAKLAHIDLPTSTPPQHDPAPGSSQPDQGRASSAGATAGVVVFSLLAVLGVSLALLATVGPQFGLELPELPDLSGLANLQF